MAFSAGEEGLPSSSSFPRSRHWPQVRRFAKWASGALGILLMSRGRQGQ